MEHPLKVTIINPEEVKDIFKAWGEFTSVCYDTDTTKTAPEKIAKHCLTSGHFSGGRWKYIAFKIEHCPRFVIDQLVRHEQGVVKNVKSFRRVNEQSFSYAVPENIKDDNELAADYWQHMRSAAKLYERIYSHVYYRTKDKDKAIEQARYILPMSTESAVCIAFDIEGLIHFCNLRLCTMTEDRHRELARAIRDAVLAILPELKDKLVPQCEYLLWCPEAHGCGRFPSKKELKEKINASKNQEIE